MSYRHVELVYERSPHRGAIHQVLIYMAGRANEHHVCWPGNDTIAADLRISKRSVAYAIKDLAEAGDILQIKQGNGRGYASTWQLGQQYWPLKDDDVAPFEADNGAYIAPFADDEAEKGANSAQKGATVAERVQLTTQKGATIAPQRNKNNKERKRNERDLAPRQAAPGRRAGELKNPALNLPADLAGLKRDWQMFQKHRMEINRPVRETEAQMLFERFRAWGIERSAAAMKYTAGNGWQGVQDDPDFNKPGRTPAGPRGQYQPVEVVRRQNNDDALARALAAVGAE